jgi:hypothetical protein
LSRFGRLRLSKRQLIDRLPDDGAPGRTSYRIAGASIDAPLTIVDADTRDEIAEISARSSTGSVLFASDAGNMLIAPPFGVEASGDFDEVHAAPLIALLERRRSYAVVLLRLGGFSIGFFRGGRSSTRRRTSAS